MRVRCSRVRVCVNVYVGVSEWCGVLESNVALKCLHKASEYVNEGISRLSSGSWLERSRRAAGIGFLSPPVSSGLHTCLWPAFGPADCAIACSIFCVRAFLLRKCPRMTFLKPKWPAAIVCVRESAVWVGLCPDLVRGCPGVVRGKIVESDLSGSPCPGPVWALSGLCLGWFRRPVCSIWFSRGVRGHPVRGLSGLSWVVRGSLSNHNRLVIGASD